MIALLLPLALYDLDGSDHGFSPSGDTLQWDWGVPASGPGGAERVWGTVLDGLHLNDAVDALEIPIPDLSGADRPVVVVRHWYDLGPGDVGRIEVDDGTGWQEVAPVYGTTGGFSGRSDGWVEHAVSLEGLGGAPRLRLVLDADATGAGDGWYVSDVEVWDGDPVAPRITPVALPEDTQDLDGPYPIRVRVIDDVGLDDVSVELSTGGGPATVLPMSSVGGDVFEALVPGQPPDTEVRWRVHASDAVQDAAFPPSGDASFRVFLAAPTDLAAPDGRVVARELPLSWTPPDTPHPVAGYRVTERDGPSYDVPGPSAVVPVTPDGTHEFTVRALYDAGPGDPSDPLAVDVEVPRLDLLDPPRAWPGDHLYVRIRGDALFLLDDLSALHLGPGVRVEALDVLGVNAAVAVVAVDPDAAVGPRDVVVEGVHGAFVFPDAFAVRDGASAPRVRAVAPSSVVQGEVADVVVRASEPFAGPVSVTTPPGLVVVSDVETDGERVSFSLLAQADVAPGVRVLVLDDGARLWDAPLHVEPLRIAQRSCSTGPSGGPWWLLGLALALRRRVGRVHAS